MAFLDFTIWKQDILVWISNGWNYFSSRLEITVQKLTNFLVRILNVWYSNGQDYSYSPTFQIQDYSKSVLQNPGFHKLQDFKGSDFGAPLYSEYILKDQRRVPAQQWSPSLSCTWLAWPCHRLRSTAWSPDRLSQPDEHSQSGCFHTWTTGSRCTRINKFVS